MRYSLKKYLSLALLPLLLYPAGPVGAQQDEGPETAAPPETRPTPPPPTMVPPPPPNIQPPSLPPGMSPPRFNPPPDTEPELDWDSIEAPEDRELIRLERFLTMPQERLTALRRAIERVEKMSPEEKGKLLERIGEIKAMSRQKRQEFLEHFEGLDRTQRRGLAAIYYTASPEEKEEIRNKLAAAGDPRQKQAFVDALLEKNQELLDRLPQPRRMDGSNPVIMRKRFRSPGEGQSEPPAPEVPDNGDPPAK